MPYISATELIMYAPCFFRLPIKVSRSAVGRQL
jgi:hypothetical protein